MRTRGPCVLCAAFSSVSGRLRGVQTSARHLAVPQAHGEVSVGRATRRKAERTTPPNEQHPSSQPPTSLSPHLPFAASSRRSTPRNCASHHTRCLNTSCANIAEGSGLFMRTFAACRRRDTTHHPSTLSLAPGGAVHDPAFIADERCLVPAEITRHRLGKLWACPFYAQQLNHRGAIANLCRPPSPPLVLLQICAPHLLSHKICEERAMR